MSNVMAAALTAPAKMAAHDTLLLFAERVSILRSL